MKFSIITCSFNNREGVLASVAALRAQVGSRKSGQREERAEEMEVEHWVIDGGSSDGTVEALRKQAESMAEKTGETAQPSPRYTLNWISETDQGLYDALNKGLRRSTGEVIGVLHTDDVWEDGVLEHVQNVFRAQDSHPPAPDSRPEGVYGDLLYVEAGDISRVRRVWRAGVYDPEKFDHGWMPPHPALFVTRSLAARVGGYRLDLGSAADYEWMLRACRVHGARLKHLPEVLVRMRVGGQSNRSLKQRLRANRHDRRAWKINGLKPRPWTLIMKPLRKLPQWMGARRIRPGG